jgi:hypothetical protein
MSREGREGGEGNLQLLLESNHPSSCSKKFAGQAFTSSTALNS